MPTAVIAKPACWRQLPEAVAQIVDRLQVGDVALPDPERIDERSERMPRRVARRVAMSAGGRQLALPFAAPFVAEPRRHQARCEPDDRSARWSDDRVTI